MLWTFVLVFGWTFVPGVTAFDQASSDRAALGVGEERDEGMDVFFLWGGGDVKKGDIPWEKWDRMVGLSWICEWVGDEMC